MAAISAAKKKCVIIALDSNDANDKYSGVSPVVARGFLNDKIGSTIPFAVISSPDQTVRYAELTYKTLTSKSSTSKSVSQAVEKMKTSKSALPSDMDELAIFSKGGTYNTLYITDIVSDTEFKYSRKPKMGGKGQIYDTSNSKPGLKRYSKRLMEIKSEAVNSEREKLAKELMPKFDVEAWTNNEGKAIQATFLSLVDGQITLSMPRKSKPVTFALTLLNAESQARAKELASEVAQAMEKINELK